MISGNSGQGVICNMPALVRRPVNKKTGADLKKHITGSGAANFMIAALIINLI